MKLSCRRKSWQHQICAKNTKGALSAEQLLAHQEVHRPAGRPQLDIPKAPLLLGQLLAKAVTEGAFGDDALQEVCQPIEDTEARRELLAHILKTVQKQSGDNAVKKLSTSKGLDISKLLQGDPEFDSQLESSKDFLIKQGLQFLSV
ncbi:TPA: Eukaryotic translation initiation factor 4 gamma 1 [Trebouxia sp. C0005]